MTQPGPYGRAHALGTRAGGGADARAVCPPAVPPAGVPLPAGFGIALDPGTRFVGSDVLFGGSPPRLLRLNRAGLRALDELRDRPVGSPQSARLARRLTDAGLAHPHPPAAPGRPMRPS